MSPAFDPIWLNCSLLSEVFEIKMQLPHFCTISDAASGLLLVKRETSEPSTQIMSALPAAFWAMDASITIAFGASDCHCIYYVKLKTLKCAPVPATINAGRFAYFRHRLVRNPVR